MAQETHQPCNKTHCKICFSETRETVDVWTDRVFGFAPELSVHVEDHNDEMQQIALVADVVALVRQRDELAASKERIHRRAQQVESENKRMRDDLVSLAGLSRHPERRLPSDLVRKIVERVLGGREVTEAAVAELDARLRSAVEEAE